MSSLDVAAHVRQLAGTDFPILPVSEGDWAQIEYRATRAGVSAFVEDVRRSREAGMNEHVSKPVDLERLQDVLRRSFPGSGTST